MTVDAILPAAGLATRMRGIPKFLLPADHRYRTLIELHIESLLNVAETIWIPTRPEQVLLLDSLGITQEKVVVVPMTTATMNHTVRRILEISSAQTFALVMPDTRFIGNKPYEALRTTNNNTMAKLALWEIRSSQKGKLGQVKLDANKQIIDMQDKDPACPYPYAWGALSFQRELAPFIHPADPHVGYALKAALAAKCSLESEIIDGQYFDCGTPQEYIEMLKLSQELTK